MKCIPLLASCILAAAWQDPAPVRPLPNRTKCRQTVAPRAWAKGLKQIPSTVIDKGVLRNVPYTSYRAGDYELNVYGDPAAPCCVELGVYKELTKSVEAKKNCMAAITALFSNQDDRKLIASLNLEVDKKLREGLTFEITPPTAEDAYGGWWISIYSEAGLDLSRASDKELEKITTTRQSVKQTDAEKQRQAGPIQVEPVAEGRWGTDDLKDARQQKDVAEEQQAVYKPAYSRKNGVYVPDRTEDDTGYILFICANSGKHEDREELIKACPACKKDSTFFWDADARSFVCFQCGVPFESSLIKCSGCGTVPKRVRTKHK